MNQRPIYTLTSDHFTVDNGALQINMMGITFCMFWSRSCQHSPKIIPEFQKLLNVVSGINLALMCIDDQQRKIVQMASRSSTPFKHVPTFIIYHDGTPVATYDGAGTLVGFSNFLKEIIPKIKQQEQARPVRTRISEPQQPDMQPPMRQLNPPNTQQYGQGQPQGPPQGQQGGRQQPGTGRFTINPSTQVKEYESSYGRPYNTANEAEFLESEAAYVPKR